MTTTEIALEGLQSITVTESAAARILQLMEERDLEGYSLRLFVSGGGCSGYQYGMAMEATPRDDDIRIIAQDDVQVVVDPLSYSYVSGATIDYVDDLMGGGFNIENPNAASTCGCGHSFKAEGDEQNTAPHAHTSGGCNC
jgi:iron-sulfur cluster assembly accessory protein